MIFTEEQKEIQALVHTFAEKEIRPISRKYDELGEFPMELYKKACRMQLNCLDLPAEYGGTRAFPSVSAPTASGSSRFS